MLPASLEIDSHAIQKAIELSMSTLALLPAGSN